MNNRNCNQITHTKLNIPDWRCRATNKIVAFSLLAGLSVTANALDTTEASLTETEGTVLIQRNQVYVIQEGATSLKPNDSVLALENSSATVQLGDCEVRLNEGSVFIVQEYASCEAAEQSIVAVSATFIPKEKRAPGSFEIDPEAAERALERTLVQSGALMLAPGRLEVTGAYIYSRRESENTVLANVGTDLVLATEKTNRNESTANLGLRLGMPWDSQLELNMPYTYVDENRTTNLAAAGSLNASNSGGGIGDIRLGIAKTLMRESRWKPDTILRLNYDIDTGKSEDGGTRVGDDFQQIGGSFTFLKRQDPLAFIATLNYASSFENKNIKPGDNYGLTLGTILAASPKTSLQFSFSNTFIQETELNGEKIPGSDGTQGILSLAATSVVSRDSVFIVSLGVGINEAAPDYTLSISVPLKFQLF